MEAAILRNLWRHLCYKQHGITLLEELKQAILLVGVLKWPDPKRRFYLNTDWSAHNQGAVLLQAGCSIRKKKTPCTNRYKEDKEVNMNFKELSRLRL